MKILLIYTNRNKLMTPPPIGLACLTKPLKEKGDSVKILNLMFLKDPEKDLIATIDKFSPDVIGYSIRNLDNQKMSKPYSQLQEIKKYIELARHRKITTIIGGPAVTTLPYEMMNYLTPDYGIAGQGEKSFAILIDSLKNQDETPEIPGLLWWDQGNLRVNKSELPGYSGIIPEWIDVNLKPFKNKAFSIPILIKTGCPFSCSYCNVKLTYGDKFIFREIDVIVDEIKQLKKNHKINTFFFVDHCINFPLDFAKNLLRRIIQEKLKIYISTSIYPIKNSYDDEFFELYRKAGGLFCLIPSDSLSQMMLKNYRKPFDLESMYEITKIASRHKVKVGIQTIFGGPGETEKTIRESLNNLKSMKFSMFTYGMGLRILPETFLLKVAIKENFVQENDSLLHPVFYFSKELNINWAAEYLEKSVRVYRYRYLTLIPMLFKIKLAAYFNIVF